MSTRPLQQQHDDIFYPNYTLLQHHHDDATRPIPPNFGSLTPSTTNKDAASTTISKGRGRAQLHSSTPFHKAHNYWFLKRIKLLKTVASLVATSTQGSPLHITHQGNDHRLWRNRSTPWYHDHAKDVYTGPIIAPNITKDPGATCDPFPVPCTTEKFSSESSCFRLWTLMSAPPWPPPGDQECHCTSSGTHVQQPLLPVFDASKQHLVLGIGNYYDPVTSSTEKFSWRNTCLLLLKDPLEEWRQDASLPATHWTGKVVGCNFSPGAKEVSILILL